MMVFYAYGELYEDFTTGENVRNAYTCEGIETCPHCTSQEAWESCPCKQLAKVTYRRNEEGRLYPEKVDFDGCTLENNVFDFEVYTADFSYWTLCKHCIEAIRSRGEKVFVGEEIDMDECPLARCEWCEDEDAGTLYNCHM